MSSYIKRMFNILTIKKKIKISETSKVRNSLIRFCKGDGLDLGYGGDPIIPSAIAMDLPESYAQYQNSPQHLHGDARSLYWFTDNCLDYLYSSHLLEDFQDTAAVLKEWIRVVKPGGKIILYLPDEQVYRQYCQSKGQPPNVHHIHEDFSLSYLREIISKKFTNCRVIHEAFPVGIYSFEIVIEKQK